MATIDQLQNKIETLEDAIDIISQTVDKHSTTLNNYGVLLNQHSTTLDQHNTAISLLNDRVDDHESRIHAIEYSELKVTITRNVKAPYVNPEGNINLFMPEDLTLEDFEKFNENVNVAINFNWFRKISNSVGKGKVCFDFDREKGIKSILIGQGTRVSIPMGFIITKLLPIKSTLKVVNHDDMIVNKGINFGIEIIKETGEVVISLCNNTNDTVRINRGEILCTLVHIFRYSTEPEITLTNLSN